jgi:hypothetical protein
MLRLIKRQIRAASAQRYSQWAAHNNHTKAPLSCFIPSPDFLTADCPASSRGGIATDFPVFRCPALPLGEVLNSTIKLVFVSAIFSVYSVFFP